MITIFVIYIHLRNLCMVTKMPYNKPLIYSMHQVQHVQILLIFFLIKTHFSTFLRATAATAVARLSHRNSLCPFVCLSVTRVDQSKTVQAMITKSLPLAAWRTLVAGSIKLFHKFERSYPE